MVFLIWAVTLNETKLNTAKAGQKANKQKFVGYL